jgi:general secretion pathway protein A
MYTSFFDLHKEPFKITPDPEFLFLSPSHKEALASIIYGVKQRKGFIAIVGEVGVGKTTIIRSFLETVDLEQVKIIYVFNADVSFKALLHLIYQGLGRFVETDDVFEMLNQLYHILIYEYKKGCNVVLIVDEAQNMPMQTLENLRMLSNLETPTDKLIQVVFSGQPEFERKIDAFELRQLRQRIAVKSTIRPLTKDESIAYVMHRLAKAAGEQRNVFSDRVLQQIVTQSKGIPRTINILCDNCLVTSFGYQQKTVTPSVFKEISSDLGIGRPEKSVSRLALLVLIFLGVCCLWLFTYIPHFFEIGLSDKSAKIANPLATNTGSAASPKTMESPPIEIGKPVEMATVAEDKREMRPQHRMVQKGDTLANLVAAHYGDVDKHLVEMVKQCNPWIRNVDHITEGEKITFPPRR